MKPISSFGKKESSSSSLEIQLPFQSCFFSLLYISSERSLLIIPFYKVYLYFPNAKISSDNMLGGLFEMQAVAENKRKQRPIDQATCALLFLYEITSCNPKLKNELHKLLASHLLTKEINTIWP